MEKLISHTEEFQINYNWLLNNMSLNCSGPLIHRFFFFFFTVTTYCSTIQSALGWFHRWIFKPTRFSTLKLCIIQGSTVYRYSTWKGRQYNSPLFFFFFLFICFNWRLIILQYYIGFAIHQHESTTGVRAALSDFFQRIQYGKGWEKKWLPSRETYKHNFSQVIKVNINSHKSCWQYVPLIWCDEMVSKLHDVSLKNP